MAAAGRNATPTARNAAATSRAVSLLRPCPSNAAPSIANPPVAAPTLITTPRSSAGRRRTTRTADAHHSVTSAALSTRPGPIGALDRNAAATIAAEAATEATA